MTSVSIDERIPQYVFTIHGQLDAKGIARQSRLEQTTTGVRWTITGELAKALQQLEKRAAEEAKWKESPCEPKP